MLNEDELIPFEPSSFPPGPWLVFAPHPDDEVFGMGGSICLAARAGITVEVVVVSNGAAAGDPETRRKECLASAEITGVSNYYFLDLPDREIAESRFPEEQLLLILKNLQPGTVFLSGIQEFHPDHRACTRRLWDWLKRNQFAGHVWLYEISRQNEANALVDISEVSEQKREAIRAFAGQLSRNDYESAVLAINASRAYTLPCPATHAEAFWAGSQELSTDVPAEQYQACMHYRPVTSFKKLPLVSIIIRTKNRAESLVRAVKSVSAQTYPSLEIILVNDGGYNVREYVEQAALHIPVDFIDHGRSLGRAAAANSGLRAAKGQYIGFLDDDDILYPEHVDHLVRHLHQTSLGAVYSSVKNVYFEGPPGNPGDRVSEEIVFNKDFDRDLILFENYIPIMSVLLSRNVLDKTGFFHEDLELFEDWDFWIRATRKHNFSHVDALTAEYRFYNGRKMQDAHFEKYSYDMARSIIFDRTLPYLNGQAWNVFLKRGLVGRLNSEKEAIHERAVNLETNLSELKAAHDKCSAWGHELSFSLSRTEEERQSLQTENIRLKEKLNAAEQKAAALNQSINCIYQSTSWKITAPLRKISSLVRKSTLNLCKGFSRILPVSCTTRNNLKTFLYTRLPFLFRGTSSFRIWEAGRNEQAESDFPEYSDEACLVDDNEILRFEPCVNPECTVIVRLSDNQESALKCLKSIIRNAGSHACHIMLVQEDHDDTGPGLLRARVSGVDFCSLRDAAQKPDRFLSEAVLGDYVLILSSDYLLLPGTLSVLTDTLRLSKNFGLAGGQLISAASQVISPVIYYDRQNNGSIKTGLDPFHPEASYMRRVEKFSDTCFCTTKDFLRQTVSSGREGLSLNGAALSRMISESGAEIVYQPQARFMEPNFQGRSGHDLHEKAECSIKENNYKGKILVIDIWTPTPDKDSGSMDIFSYFRIFTEMGYQVTFMPAADMAYDAKYTSELQKIGVKCIYKPYFSHPESYLRQQGSEYDLVLLYRVHCAAGHIDMVRKYCPQARVVFDTVDLHFLREERQARMENSKELLRQSRETRTQELSLIDSADATIVLSQSEKELLKNNFAVNNGKIHVIPLIRDIQGCSKDFDSRKGLVFIGGFQHQPNTDAVIYFLAEIWPLIKQSLPDMRMSIIGSSVPAEVKNLCGQGVELLGFVQDIEPVFSRCRLSVAPLRYGAGLKGKVATSLCHGVPCVASSIAVEGSGLENGQNVMIADEPKEFARAVIELHEHKDLWNRLSAKGLEHVLAHYSLEAGREKIEKLLKKMGMEVQAL